MLKNYFLIAFRNWRKQPGHSAINIGGLEQLTRHSSIRGAAAASNRLGERIWIWSLRPEGRRNKEDWTVNALLVDDDYLATSGRELLVIGGCGSVGVFPGVLAGADDCPVDGELADGAGGARQSREEPALRVSRGFAHSLARVETAAPRPFRDDRPSLLLSKSALAVRLFGELRHLRTSAEVLS